MKEDFKITGEHLQKRDEIPVPHDRLLLLDKDLTLVDHSYNITDVGIFDAIQNIQSSGWTIGLNSDTPLDVLKHDAQELGLNGPIIAERGAIVNFDERTIVNEEDMEMFSHSKEALITLLQEVGIPTESHNGLEIFEQIKAPGTPHDTKVFFNNSRQLSIGMFFRSYDEYGVPYIDEEFTTEIAQELMPLYPNFDDLLVDLNHEYGILILSRDSSHKRPGTMQYMQELGFTQIGMVGNSISDFIGNDIALHYAVGNSTEEFKKNADYIAEGTITSGVIEILDKIGQKLVR